MRSTTSILQSALECCRTALFHLVNTRTLGRLTAPCVSACIQALLLRGVLLLACLFLRRPPPHPLPQQSIRPALPSNLRWFLVDPGSRPVRWDEPVRRLSGDNGRLGRTVAPSLPDIPDPSSKSDRVNRCSRTDLDDLSVQTSQQEKRARMGGALLGFPSWSFVRRNDGSRSGRSDDPSTDPSLSVSIQPLRRWFST